MSEALISIATAAIGLAALVIIALAALKGWHGWLEVKRLELGGRGRAPAADRIELADLKERVRKLEAIAACVDL
jgi:hypothetical protein